ncbi:MAG: hypothetical protein Kapaf2KO_16290 [Candidatus Kapaibacteriales bacterium]
MRLFYIFLFSAASFCVTYAFPPSSDVDTIANHILKDDISIWKPFDNDKAKVIKTDRGIKYTNKADWINWNSYEEPFFHNMKYRISTTLKRSEKGSHGVIFDYFNNKNYKKLTIDEKGKVEFWDVIGGQPWGIDGILSTPLPSPNKWMEVVIENGLYEPGFHIYIDGKEYYSNPMIYLNYGKYFGYTADIGGTVEAESILIEGSKKEINLIADVGTEADYNILELPSKVNIEGYANYMPNISPDGSRLYYSVKKHPNNKGGKTDLDEVWFANKKPNGEWEQGKPAKDSINSTGPNWVISITPDNNSVVIANVPNKDLKPGTSGVARSFRKKNDDWTLPKKIEVKGAFSNSKWVNYSFSGDGQYLFMSSEQDERPSNDLYVFKKKDDGTWSEKINLGSKINTTGGEATPLLAADNKTLYFSSEGQNGYGSYDMFVSRRLDDTWQIWTVPENLGPYINTKNKDFGITLEADGKFGYLVRYAGDGNSSKINQFVMPLSGRPEPVLIIEGVVYDIESKLPLEADIVYNDMTTGSIMGSGTSNTETGEYKIVLPLGKSYGISAERQGYYSITESAEPEALEDSQIVKVDIAMQPIKVGSQIRLNNLFFDTGKYTLKPSSKNELDKVIKLLMSEPAMKISIDGHTDNVGNDSNNMELSINRSTAVVDYLEENGIARDRLKIVGYGEDKPIETNSTDAGRKANRRVEMTVLEI